eukprot:gene23480-biopygen11151
MLLAMHEQPLSDKALRELDVVVGPNDKNAIVVSDHVPLQHFTSAAMRFFASEGSVAYRRMGMRYVQQTTSSDVLLNAWSVNPFEPQLPLVERGEEDPDAWSSSSSRLNVAESPFEFETIGDLLTLGIDKSSRLMVVNFATIEDVLGKRKHKSSPSRGFVLKYFPLTPSRVGTTSTTSSVGPDVIIIAPNPSNPLVEVVSIEVRSVVAVARASPSFYRMIPTIRGLFSDTIPAIFGRLMSGSGDLKDLHAVQLMNGVVDNLGRSVSLKVRRSTVYEDPAMFRQVFWWLRRPPSSDCRMRAFVSLDSVGGGVAIVSFDDDLSVNVSFQRIPDASRIPDAVRLEWDARDSRYVISVEDRRGEHGKLVNDLREDILNFDAITPPSKSQVLSYRGVSGYTDSRNLFKAVANMRQLSKTDAVRIIQSRFDHLTQDQCEEAIDADRSSSDASSVVSALTLEPMLQVQSRGAFSYSITLENARPHVMMRIAGIIGRVRISELSASMLQVGGGGELLNAANKSYGDFLNSEADMLFGALSQEASQEKNLHTGSSRSGRSNYVTKNGDSSVPRSFLLESLYRADPNLFSGTTYSKMCPHVDRRQPVVVTREEFDVLPSNSYGDRAIAYGSSKETSARNIYICPTVWCPMSRVSMTRDQLVSAGGRCPGGPGEEPILYDSKYFRKSKNKNHRHVGFSGSIQTSFGVVSTVLLQQPGKRVDQCEAKDAGGGSGKTSSNNITGSTNRKTKNRTDEKHVSVSSPSSINITSFSRYVMHSGVVPLPVKGRLGALHSVLVSSQDDEDHTSIIVRVGSSGTPLDTSLLRALADVYTSGDVRVFLLSVHDVLVKSPGIFVAMGDGYVCSRFMRGGDARDTLLSPSIFEAFLVHMRSGSYATIFGLDSILLPLLGKVSRPQLLKEYDSEAVDATWTALIRELCIFGAFSRFLVALEEDNNLALSRPDVDAIADLMGTITGRLTVTLSVGGSCDPEIDDTVVDDSSRPPGDAYMQRRCISVVPELCNIHANTFSETTGGKTDFGVVVNMDPSWMGGSHWAAMYGCIDRSKPHRYGLYYYDSLGKEPPAPILQFMKRFVAGTDVPIGWNTIQKQYGDSDTLNTNVLVHEFGLLCHASKSFLGASPDGVTEDGVMLEIKCPWRRKIDGTVPMQYYLQIQGQLAVSGLLECDYFEVEFDILHSEEEIEAEFAEISRDESIMKSAFRGVRKHSTVKVHADTDFSARMIDTLEGVWNDVTCLRFDKDMYDQRMLDLAPVRRSASSSATVIKRGKRPPLGNKVVCSPELARGYAFLEDANDF